MTAPARVALAGTSGYGAVHLANIARQTEAGLVELMAVADPKLGSAALPAGTARFASLPELLSSTAVDIVIVATPIHTHAPLAALSLAAGADVLLEKPPTASVAEYEQLSSAMEEAGRAVQVGFQSLGSAALTAFDNDAFGLGTPRHVRVLGSWTRDVAYWGRSPWAGKRTLDGAPVMDGAVTNPFAHAVATALRMVGARRTTDIESVEVELFRANHIESDDTASIRILTSAGSTVICAFTLCAGTSSEPTVIVDGNSRHASFRYQQDLVTVGDLGEFQFDREDLLVNLIHHRRNQTPLVSSLGDSGAFMQIVEAIRLAPDPRRIPAEHVKWVGEGPAKHAVISDIEDYLVEATGRGRLFSELGIPWARDLRR